MTSFLRLTYIFFWVLCVGSVSASYESDQAHASIPCAREGGYMGFNLGFCGGFVRNNKVTPIGSPLSALDIEIPNSVLGIGYLHPETLQRKVHQSGFMVGIEMGCDFAVSGKPGQRWLLGWFGNGSFSTTRGSALFNGEYQYPDGIDPITLAPIMSSLVTFQEKLRIKNKGFWSTGLRFGPTVDRAFIYLKGGFMMTRMTVGGQVNDLSRLGVPSRVVWFPGAVVGLGIEFNVTPVFVMGVDLTANLCSQKEMTVAFPDLGGAILVQMHPFYAQALLTLKYKFPARRQLTKPTATHSVYRPQW
jgi:hypothetical protein